MKKLVAMGVILGGFLLSGSSCKSGYYEPHKTVNAKVYLFDMTVKTQSTFSSKKKRHKLRLGK
jgi:hypothetical protein